MLHNEARGLLVDDFERACDAGAESLAWAAPSGAVGHAVPKDGAGGPHPRPGGRLEGRLVGHAA